MTYFSKAERVAYAKGCRAIERKWAAAEAAKKQEEENMCPPRERLTVIQKILLTLERIERNTFAALELARRPAPWEADKIKNSNTPEAQAAAAEAMKPTEAWPVASLKIVAPGSSNAAVGGQYVIVNGLSYSVEDVAAALRLWKSYKDPTK